MTDIFVYAGSILGGIAFVITAISGYQKTTIRRDESVATGWQGVVKVIQEQNRELAERITTLEKGVKEREITHAQELEAKNKRISELEARVDELEEKLSKYESLDTKVETAKNELHHAVEDNLNDIKPL